MLVLTRKIGEKLQVGNNITITILSQESDQIKIGIEAPREIPIYREEVYNRIREKNRLSIASSSGIIDHLNMVFGEKKDKDPAK